MALVKPPSRECHTSLEQALTLIVLIALVLLGVQFLRDSQLDAESGGAALTFDSAANTTNATLLRPPNVTRRRSKSTHGPSSPPPLSQRPYAPVDAEDDSPSAFPSRIPSVDPRDVTKAQWEAMKAKGEWEACPQLKRCRFPCSWAADNAVNPCFEGCVCPTPDCMVVGAPAPPSQPRNASSGYRCVKNPFYARSANVTGRQGLPCLGERPTSDPPPPIHDSMLPHEKQLRRFKRQTRDFFDNWVDWPAAECADTSTLRESGEMRVTYDTNDHAYTLHNMCVRSDGRLAAYLPVGVPSYNDRSSTIYGSEDREAFFSQIEPLRAAPSCVRRQRAYLDYIITPHHNTYFAAVKSAALLKYLKHKWPSAANDVLMLRVISPAVQKSAHLVNAHNYFRGLLSRFGWASMWHRPQQKSQPPPEPSEDVGMVCFDKIVTLHPCETDMCDGGATQGELSNLKWKVIVEGTRLATERAAVQSLRDEMAKCTGIARASANKERPRLVIVDRHHKKRYANLNMVMARIADHAFAAGFSTLHVVDQQDGIEPLGLVRLHQRADVMLGHFGGGMTWLFAQPPGSVAIETAVGSCADGHFSQWDSATECDYGGLSHNADVSHYASFVSKESRLMHEDLQLTPEYWAKVIDLALCKLRANPVGGRSLNPNDCEALTPLHWQALLPDSRPTELMLHDP